MVTSVNGEVFFFADFEQGGTMAGCDRGIPETRGDNRECQESHGLTKVSVLTQINVANLYYSL